MMMHNDDTDGDVDDDAAADDDDAIVVVDMWEKMHERINCIGLQNIALVWAKGRICVHYRSWMQLGICEIF